MRAPAEPTPTGHSDRPTATPTATPPGPPGPSQTVTVGGTVEEDFIPNKTTNATTASGPTAALVSWPRSIAGKSKVVFPASSEAGHQVRGRRPRQRARCAS